MGPRIARPVHAAIEAVYDAAYADSAKPPNIRELPAAVPPGEEVAHEQLDGFGVKRRVMSPREAVGSWQGRIEVTSPGSRVLARAESLGLRGVQHPLDPSAQPAGCFRLRRPDGRRALQDALRVDLIDPLRPNRLTIGRQSVAPLLAVLGVGKTDLDPINQGERIVAELRDLPVRPAGEPPRGPGRCSSARAAAANCRALAGVTPEVGDPSPISCRRPLDRRGRSIASIHRI
jgi:hypothetical protein